MQVNHSVVFPCMVRRCVLCDVQVTDQDDDRQIYLREV